MSPNQIEKTMSTARESQNSRVAVFEHIEKMLEPGKEFEASHLKEIIKTIDEVLFEAKHNTETISEDNCEQKGLKGFQTFGHMIKTVGDKISTFCQNNIETGIKVLEILGHCHWALVGFVLVASVLENLKQIKENKKECLMLLKSMNDLAKIALELLPLPQETENTKATIMESIHTILQGAICCSRMKDGSGNKDDLVDIRREVEELRSTLHAHISVCIFKWLCENGKECGGMKNSDTNAELKLGNDRDERSSKKRERDSNESTDQTQISRIPEHEGGSHKRSCTGKDLIESQNLPQTPSPSKAKPSPVPIASKEEERR